MMKSSFRINTSSQLTVKSIFCKDSCIRGILISLLIVILLLQYAQVKEIQNIDQNVIINAKNTTISLENPSLPLIDNVLNENNKLPSNDNDNDSSPSNDNELNENHSTPLVNQTYYDTKSTYSPPNTPGAFIHIGKTGGSTLSTLLRNGCHSWVKKPCYQPQNETYASKLTTYYHIPDFENGQLVANIKFIKFLIFTMRDPLSRTISAFMYSHPENVMLLKWEAYWKNNEQKYKKFGSAEYFKEIQFMIMKREHKEEIELFKCFPTIDDFAIQLGRNSSYYHWPSNHSDCENLSRSIFHKKVELKISSKHLYWDYGMLYNKLGLENDTKLRILATRQEYLWQDWESVNLWLGQSRDTFLIPNQELNMRDNNKSNYNLSEIGKENLCYALEHEYKIYFQILKRAVNLNLDDFEASKNIAVSNCPNLNWDNILY